MMNNAQLIEQMELKSKCQYFELPEYSRIDGYLQNDEGIAWFVELKTRNFPSDQYDTALIDLDKWGALKTMQELTGVATLLVYGWSNGKWGVLSPLQAKNMTYSVVTPSMDSVSFNKGVERNVIKVPVSEFALYETA